MTPETLLMPLPENCVVAAFIRRVKRFTVEAEKDGRILLAHCNDTGAMTGLLREGAPVLLSRAENPKRKLPWTLERIRPDDVWIGVNSRAPNRLLAAAFKRSLLPFAADYRSLRPEAARGAARLDALFEAPGKPRFWVECKSVSLTRGDLCQFPDARSERARKHLRELTAAVKNGERAAMFYLARHPKARFFAPASDVDPEYGRLFREATRAGVEIYVYSEILRADGSLLGSPLPLKPE